MKRQGGITLRSANGSDARGLYTLISANRAEGHLLPRTLDELAMHATRFVVATRGRRIVGCAELASLSPTVAEIRSLAVDRRERSEGIGTMIVDELRRRARHEGFEKLCAFTHAPAYFIHMGFSIVPHTWLLEKLATDCVNCPLFRTCGQYAMVVQFDDAQGRPLEPVYEVDRAAAAPQPAAVARYAS